MTGPTIHAESYHRKLVTTCLVMLAVIAVAFVALAVEWCIKGPRLIEALSQHRAPAAQHAACQP